MKWFYSIIRYFKRVDKVLLFLVITASAYGCMLIYSATHTTGMRETIVQTAAIGMGLIIAIILSLIDYEWLSKMWPVLAGISITLMIITLAIGVGPSGSDNKAWLVIDFLNISIQPSEFLKIVFIITFARHLQRVKEDINRFRTVIGLGLHAILPFGMVLLTKDDGSATIFLVITVCMLLAAGLSWKYFLAGGTAVAVAIPLLWFFYFDDFQRQRFLVVFDPEKYDPSGLTDYFQQLQSKIAIGSGQVIGQGYLNGLRTQNGVVPKNYNDFILTVAGEEFGFIGVILVFGLLMAIFLRILWVGKRSHFSMGNMICVGIFAQLGFQAILNIGMCLALFPVIGVTLPFFSAGGSSMLALFISIGLVLSIYMHNEKRSAYDDGFRL